MPNPYRRAPAVIAALAALISGHVLSACSKEAGADAAVADAAGPDPLEAIRACGLPGQYRVTSAPAYACEEWPRVGEIVSVRVDGGVAVMRAGLVEVPIALKESCAFEASGCAASDERYFAPALDVAMTTNGIRFIARAIDVKSGRVGPCAEGTFDAMRVADCQPEGRYEATAEAAITSGSCDLGWGAGAVVIEKFEDGTWGIDWAGTDIDGLVLDEASCTLRGSKGKSPSIWMFNNAPRTVELELRVTSEGLEGTASDRLSGTTFDGKSCAGATFALKANRPATRGAQPLAAACETPPPPACGNGICESGEECVCSDCTCAVGQECASDRKCHAKCTLLTESTDCAAAERCSAIGRDCRALFSHSALYCEAVGAAVRGQECKCNHDCAAGLICHVSEKLTKGLCAPPCGEGFPECPTGEICAAQGDGSGSGSYPTAQPACERLAAPGEDCTLNACAWGFYCGKYCVNGACSTFCTQTCSSGSQCPPEIPVCSSLGMCVER